jgi:MFS family permease
VLSDGVHVRPLPFRLEISLTDWSSRLRCARPDNRFQWNTYLDLRIWYTGRLRSVFSRALLGSSLARKFSWRAWISKHSNGSLLTIWVSQGSMPTDGTLLLENVPKSKQYLVTALSVFFSIGAVLAAIVALVIVPPNSCPPEPAPCDVAADNNGWRYLLGGLGIIVGTIIRIVIPSDHSTDHTNVHCSCAALYTSRIAAIPRSRRKATGCSGCSTDDRSV